MSIATQLSRGDFAYVNFPFGGVKEARVVAVGERYKIRLLEDGSVREVPPANVWEVKDYKMKRL